MAFFSGVMTIGKVPAFLLNHHAAEALGYPTDARLWIRQGPSLLDIGLEPASDSSDGALVVRPTWEHEGTAEVCRQHRAKWPLAVYVEGVLAMHDVPGSCFIRHALRLWTAAG